MRDCVHACTNSHRNKAEEEGVGGEATRSTGNYIMPLSELSSTLSSPTSGCSDDNSLNFVLTNSLIRLDLHFGEPAFFLFSLYSSHHISAEPSVFRFKLCLRSQGTDRYRHDESSVSFSQTPGLNHILKEA